MINLFISICLAIFLAFALGAIFAPKIWQRIVIILITIVIVGLSLPMVSHMAKEGEAAIVYRKQIRPTGILWETVKTDLVQKKYDQALATVDFIIKKWQEIEPYSESYSAEDLVKELETNITTNASQTIGTEAAP